MRIALGVEYDGSAFHGWQRQPGLRTAQGELERALSSIANEEGVKVYCAGRTDTGVHGLGQVIHFDTHSERSEKAWIFGTNALLPKDVSVTWSREVDDEFHARKSALARHYRYIIVNDAVRPSVLRGHVTWHYFDLDADMMHEAAQHLVGEHDFSSFRSVQCQSHSVHRHLEKISVKRQGKLIIVDVIANAFLHHMVRNIVGTLMTVGGGRQDVEWIIDVLEAKDRAAAAETAPPYGLYLLAVRYPEQYDLPYDENGPLLAAGSTR